MDNKDILDQIADLYDSVDSTKTVPTLAGVESKLVNLVGRLRSLEQMLLNIPLKR